MTTYLDWRMEPETDVAEEIEVTRRKSKTSNHMIYKVYCPPCDWWDVAIDDFDEIKDLRNEHIKWHMEGCPE